MRLGMLTACLPGRSLDGIAGCAADQGYEALEERRHRYGPPGKAVARKDPSDVGTDEEVHTGLQVTCRTLRPLIVA